MEAKQIYLLESVNTGESVFSAFESKELMLDAVNAAASEMLVFKANWTEKEGTFSQESTGRVVAYWSIINLHSRAVRG